MELECSPTIIAGVSFSLFERVTLLIADFNSFLSHRQKDVTSSSGILLVREASVSDLPKSLDISSNYASILTNFLSLYLPTF